MINLGSRFGVGRVGGVFVFGDGVGLLLFLEDIGGD